jgi:hypothetical protein
MARDQAMTGVRFGAVWARVGMAVVLAVALGGCGVGPLPGEPTPDVARGVPGFDTRDYPGDATMRTWLEHSPYRWVGYYLESPCFTGTGWDGARGGLEALGWGMAVLFVGEQDWAEILPAEQVIADPEAPRCTVSNLTAERGRTDGAAAASAAAAQGFPSGTSIYLNVERVERVSSALRDYVREWTVALLEDGRYAPAMYAHAHNAEELRPIQVEGFARVGDTRAPRLWVARTGGFSLVRGPGESGFRDAYIWQGVLDARETWGGVTLRIDANVARSASPSG